MLQHTSGLLYTNQRIHSSVWWVVPAFVILGGYNVMSSWRDKKAIDMPKKISKIFIPYVICTCIYVAYENRFFHAERVWQALLYFNAAGPLYFVAVYIQMLIITPLLVGCICWAEEKCRCLRHMSILTLIFFASYFTDHYTDILRIPLGGGNLFGGCWLIFWYGGMLFAVKKRELNARVKLILAVVLWTLCLLWEYVFILKGWNSRFGSMYHSATIVMTWWNALEAFLVVFFIKETVELLESKENKLVMRFLSPICYIGRKSLYIFMYHLLFRDIYFTYFSYGNIWIKRVTCFGFMVGGALCLEYCLRKLKQGIDGILNRSRRQNRTVV